MGTELLDHYTTGTHLRCWYWYAYDVCSHTSLSQYFGIATSVWFTWSLNEASPGRSVLLSTVWLRSKYFYICTLALNVLCTSRFFSIQLQQYLTRFFPVLIAYKIWSIQRHVSSTYYGRGPNVMFIILESGMTFHTIRIAASHCSLAAIYSALLIVLIGTTVAHSPSMFIILNSVRRIW